MSSTKWPFFTKTGKMINLELIERYDIDEFDIATGLANTCRWGGQCKQFYSVAQHCNIAYDMAKISNPDFAPYVLLHDAHEAYIGDIISPVKSIIDESGQLAALEKRVDNAILEKFNLREPTLEIKEFVSEIDHVLLLAESRDLIARSTKNHKWLRDRAAAYFQETDDKYQLLNIPVIVPVSRIKAHSGWINRLADWWEDE